MSNVQKLNNKFCDEIKQIQIKHPDRIPVVVALHKDCKINLTKFKYLVPRDLTYGQFLYVIRNKLKLSSSTAIFMFFGDNLPYQTQKMSNIYDNYSSEDGFLRATITNENTFG